MERTAEPARTPRRAPAAEERRIDAERSRCRLLEAAKDEFAAKGYAGARVADIAARAGLNKQLISYYFGGKAGLYRELHQVWLEREAAIAPPELPLADLLPRYLSEALADPRTTRLILWRALDEAAEQAPGVAEQAEQWQRDLADMRRRQAEGELAADLDPGTVLLMLMSAVIAPLLFPQATAALTGLEPRSPEFEARYAEQLVRLARRLAQEH